jgi:hypothetical protein
LAGIAYRGVDAGIRHAHHHVSLHGMLQRQESACPLPRDMSELPSITLSGRAK